LTAERIESHGRPEETLEGSKWKRVDMHTSFTYGNRGGTNCQQLNVNGDEIFEAVHIEKDPHQNSAPEAVIIVRRLGHI
jgi:hypothetical protein